MQTMRYSLINRKILTVLLVLFLAASMLSFDSTPAEAKSYLSLEDAVKTVLLYFTNSAGEEVLLAQLGVSEMFDFLNDNLEGVGKVHNYSILDSYVTTVHREAQGFTVGQLLAYALSNSQIPNAEELALDFSGSDTVAFWEIDGAAFDTVDTYTYNSLYGVERYNFPALYENWNYETKTYKNPSAVWESCEPEEAVLSITAYSERYIASGQYGISYDMENYFFDSDLPDTARTMRLMLPMTEMEMWEQIPTAMNSRWGICYILLDMVTGPDFSLGEVAKPTYTLIDGDESVGDEYETGYWYFAFECETPGATIYYNDNSNSNYMPTAVYNEGEPLKVKKSDKAPAVIKFRAVKDGYTDVGIQTASSRAKEEEEETVDPDADIWDGKSIDTSWYVGHESDAEYTITRAAELAGLAALVNNVDGNGAVTFENKAITLAAPIHLNGHVWEPIGTDMGRRSSSNSASIDADYYYVFSGTFDGSGHTISGINVSYLRATGSYSGLFGKLANATVKNLTLSGSVYSITGRGLGGFAGRTDSSTLVNCINKASVEGAGMYTPASMVGGIVGVDRGGSSFENCVNYGTIIGASLHGGILGEGFGSSDPTTIKDCINYGRIDGSKAIGSNCIGGICGTDGLISRCVNHAVVIGGSNVGGIVGRMSMQDAVADCINFGAVTAIHGYAGGIVGASNSRRGISNCLNLGPVDNSEGVTDRYTGAGGICGEFSSKITACVNYGAVSARYNVGGLAGRLTKSEASIVNSYNMSTALSSWDPGRTYSGGIAGFVEEEKRYTDTHIFSNCYDLSGGAVFGSVTTGTSANISNVYYLQGGIEIGDQPDLDRYGIDSRTEAQMRRVSFVTMLGQYNANGNGPDDGCFVFNPGGYPVLYWQPTEIAFEVEPDDAEITVFSSTPATVPANPDGTYTLNLGETYTYEATADGYISKTDTFTVTGAETLKVVLHKDKVVAEGPGQIILSWTEDPTTTQSVIWCDNSGEEGYLQYLAEGDYSGAESFNDVDRVAAASTTVGYGSAAGTYYEATMTGLLPGTAYYYRVGSGDKWSDPARFSTAPLSTDNFSFMYMGDIQHNTTAAAEYPLWGSLLADAYAANTDLAFGLLGGDMVQSGSDMNDWTYFLSYASEVFSRIPMMTTIGNHESNFPAGKAEFYLDILALPTNGPVGFEEEFYSFDYGPVHVTVLNSWALSQEQDLDETRKAGIADWIRADLAAAENAKFRLVLLHHPAYALAPDLVSASVLSEWAPLLETGRVDLALCGHQHVYNRSYPLRAGEIDYENGIVWVMGNSGRKYYSTADTTYSEKTILNESTYQIINIDGEILTLSTYDGAGNLLDFWSTTAKSGGDGALLAPPLLIADSLNNRIGENPILGFMEDEGWETALSGITVNGTALESDSYSVAPGSIIIDKSIFSTAGDYAIVVSAEGYSDATVTQTMKAAVGGNPIYIVTPVADAAYTIGSTLDGIGTMSVNADCGGLRYFNVGIDPVIPHIGDETAVFVHLRDAIQLGLNASRADFDLIREASAGFNVLAGDMVKIYLVDELSNAADFNPTVFH